MTARNRTTPMPEGATDAHYFITRPKGLSDEAWAWRTDMANLATLGHYPWCSVHEDGEDDHPGWCTQEVYFQDLGAATITSGTMDGRPVIDVNLDKSIDLEKLSMVEASRLAAMLEIASRTAMFYNGGAAK